MLLPSLLSSDTGGWGWKIRDSRHEKEGQRHGKDEKGRKMEDGESDCEKKQSGKGQDRGANLAASCS